MVKQLLIALILSIGVMASNAAGSVHFPAGPDGDTCDDCIPVGEGVFKGTTSDNNAEADITSCTFFDTVTEWYCYTASCNGSATVSTCGGANYDTALSAWDGCPGGGAGSDCCESNGSPGCDNQECQDIVCAVDPFCCNNEWDGICADEAADLCGDLCSLGATQIACNDDACGLQSTINFDVVAGGTYYIRVSGFKGDSGNFEMNITCEVDVSPTCPWDLDGDEMVAEEDIRLLFDQWGTDGPADFDGSGTVAINDLLILFANWGLCPPIVGACCIYGAGCMMLTEAECIEQAGVFFPDLECKDGPYGPYCPYGYGSFAQLFGQQRPSFAFAALITVLGLLGLQMAVAGKRS